MPDGTAAAPADAPVEVQQAIWAANTIQDLPYRYGGGHAKVEDTAATTAPAPSRTRCIHAGLLKSPLDSGSFMRWGKRGTRPWITVFTNSGHAFAVIAGLRLDTSSYATRAAQQAQVLQGTRARTPLAPHKAPGQGFRKRHPVGF